MDPSPVAVWVAALYCLGFALIVLEIFIPGWVAGTAGVLCLGLSVWMAWKMSAPVSILLLAGAAGGIPLAVIWGMNRVALKKGLSSSDGYVSSDLALAALVGKRGSAATLLRPSGMVEIDGRRFDSRAERGFIERGSAVAVLRVEANELIVRELNSETIGGGKTC